METSFKIKRLGCKVLLLPAMVLLLHSPYLIGWYILKTDFIVFQDGLYAWQWILIIIYSLAVLVISYFVTLRILNLTYEGWKLEMLNAKDQEKEAKALKRYEEELKKRIEMEQYKLSVDFIKYVMDLDPNKSTEAGLPGKELMNQLNHFIAEHKKIISSSENPKTAVDAD